MTDVGVLDDLPAMQEMLLFVDVCNEINIWQGGNRLGIATAKWWKAGTVGFVLLSGKNEVIRIGTDLTNIWYVCSVRLLRIKAMNYKENNLLPAGGDGEVLILQLMKDMENAELFWVASHGTVRRLKSGRHEIIHLRQPVFKTSARNIFTGNIGWLVNEKASRTGDEVTWSERPMQAESRWDTHRDSSP